MSMHGARWVAWRFAMGCATLWSAGCGGEQQGVSRDVQERLAWHEEQVKSAAPGVARSHALLHRATFQWTLHQWDSAIHDADEALSHSPEQDMAYFVRARSLASLERFDEAFGDFERAIELRPEQAQYRVQYAELLESVGRYTVAAQQWARLQEDWPDEGGYTPRRIMALAAAGKGDEAEAIVASLDEASLDVPALRLALGKISLDNGDTAAAAAHFERAWELGDQERQAGPVTGRAAIGLALTYRDTTGFAAPERAALFARIERRLTEVNDELTRLGRAGMSMQATPDPTEFYLHLRHMLRGARGLLAEVDGDHDQALTDLTAAAEDDRLQEFRIDLARVMLARGQPQPAGVQLRLVDVNELGDPRVRDEWFSLRIDVARRLGEDELAASIEAERRSREAPASGDGRAGQRNSGEPTR